MDDLELLREHLPEAPAPSDDAKRRASARLAQAIRDETQRATARDHKQTPVAGLLHLFRTRPRRSALVFATLVAAAAAALFLSAPWKDSPGFLAKAEAALSRAGTVLHMKMQTTSTWTRPTCKVTYSQAEVWIDETLPNTYRLLLNDLPPPHVNAAPLTRGCFSGRVSEIGGSYRSTETLRFVPPNTLGQYAMGFRFPLNPAADLRQAISAGRAHDEGKTKLDGRTVERIRIDPPSNCRMFANCPRDPLYVYVDPLTFYPVQTVGTTSQVEIVGGPGRSSHSHVRVRDVTRYVTFEYLPRTDANRKLTDIRARHPNATSP
jgi:hypothetical protein